MSGIAGIYNTNGRPVDCEALDHMVATLSHRGPDGMGVWLNRSVGLGHRMFHETPESIHEQQPCVSSEMQLALTADARIDNRVDLIRQLDLTTEDHTLVSDSRLILLAYARWREKCVEHLIGDFAFALWDGLQQSLFCARDPFGIKPFYYGFLNNRFLFASELRGILCIKDVPHELDEEMIANYLALYFEDKEITFYKGLMRLPPAYTMRVDQHGIHLHCYWRADPVHELRLKSDVEYAEAFREVFAEAVRCRLRSAFPIGSTLSGGMDSSSITCMARNLLACEGQGRTLKTFSGIFNHLPQVDERRYMKMVIAAGGIEPHLVSMDDLGPLDKYMEGQQHEEHPYVGTNYCLHWGLRQQMRNQGIRVVLDGHGGDDTVNHGYFYLTELARSFRMMKFFKECRACAKMHNRPISIFMRDGLRPLIPSSLLSFWRRARCIDKPREPSLTPIAQGLLKRTGMWDSIHNAEMSTDKSSTLRQDHARAFSTGLIGFLFESLDKLGYGHSLVTRYPFYDQRLVEFCVSLPPEQKLCGGWTRMVLRRAMEGILPSENQWRLGKTSLSPHFNKMLLGKERQLLQKTIERVSVHIEEYVDVKMLRDRCSEFLVNSDSVDRNWRAVWPALTLGTWMAERSYYAKGQQNGAYVGMNQKYAFRKTSGNISDRKECDNE